MVGEALQRDTGNFYYLNCDGFTGVYVFLKTDQIIHFKYKQFIVYPFYVNKVVKLSNNTSQAKLFAKSLPHGPAIFHSASEAFTGSLIKNVEITVAGLLLYPLSS